jgi:hypothetical protein
MERSPVARLPLFFAVAVLALPLQAAPVLEGSVSEDFGGLYPQSGVGPFVGFIQGPPQGALDLSRLRAILPSDRAARQICFKATTFDGVYSAAGALRAGADATGPVAIGDRAFSRHSGNIAKYGHEQVAVSFVLSRDCELLPERSIMLLAATFGGPMNVVRVALNTRPAQGLAVSLRTAAGRTYTGICKALGQRATAFLQVCDFRIDDGGPATLQVTRKVGNAPGRTDSIDVYLANPD